VVKPCNLKVKLSDYMVLRVYGRWLAIIDIQNKLTTFPKFKTLEKLRMEDGSC
jgi:hypothetical protein